MKAKKLRSAAAMALCAAILSASVQTAAANTPELPADENMTGQILQSINVLKGDGTGDLNLGGTLGRLEAAVMIVRMRGEEELAKAAYAKGETDNPFTDVPDWAAPHVAWMFEKGLTKGNGSYDAAGNPQFGTGVCSAAEYATFMLRVLGYDDTAATPDFRWNSSISFAEELGIYTDAIDIATFDRGSMAGITYLTLAADVKNTDKSLLSTLVDAGAIDRSAAKELLTAFGEETGEQDPISPVDMDGRIFTIYADSGYTTPAGVFRDMTGLDAADSVDMALYERLQTIEKACNVSLYVEYMNVETLSQSVTRHIQAADPGFDMLIANPATVATHAAQGMMRDLNTVDGLDFTRPWWDADINRALAFSGKQYMAFSDFMIPEAGGQVGIYYNTEVVRGFGFEDPAVLAANGTWTIEKFLEITKAHYQVDETDPTLLSDGYMPRYLYNASGRTMIGRNESDQLVLDIHTMFLMESMDRYSIIPRNMFGDWMFGFDTAKEDLLTGHLLYAADTIGSADRYLSADNTLAVVPMPKMEDDQEGYFSPVSTKEMQVLSLPVTQQDDSIGAFMEYLNRTSAEADLKAAYIAQFSHGKNGEMLDLIFESTIVDLADTFPNLNLLIANQLSRGASPAAALRMQQNLIEMEIETFNTHLSELK